MESKTNNTNLRAILNSPARFTPAVPIPDWTNNATTSTSASASTSTSTTTTTGSVTTNSNSKMTIMIPHGVNDPYTTVTLQNCVATVDLGCKLNLVTINTRTRNSEYNPGRFNGVVMKIREPRSTALIFRSGKFVCTGARNEHDSYLSARKFARIIQKIGFNIKYLNFEIKNIVATCDLRFPIKLENFYQVHSQFSRYEPEMFPGLIYRLIKPRIVLLIFVNGKIVFTGGKTRQDIEESLEIMYPILKSFRKN